MPISISQSQANTGVSFLDAIGSSDFGNVNLSGTAKEIVKIAGKFVSNAKRNLLTADRRSSGSLSSSIKVGNINVLGNTMELSVYANIYYKFVDEGVNGSTMPRGSQYSYKQKGPPVKEIKAWLSKESGKHRVSARPKTKREVKRATTDPAESNARFVSAVIKKKGLKKTLFWTKAYDILVKELPEGIRAATIEDIKKSF